MTVFSEAWHDTPPKIRDFYHNYHRRYLAHCWKAEWSIILGQWIAFIAPGWAFLSYPGHNIAYGNWGNQLADFGFFDPAIVLMEDNPFYPPPPIQPVHDFFTWGDLPDQFVVVPRDSLNYPRAKYKVRKSYWTGKPRRRQNL